MSSEGSYSQNEFEDESQQVIVEDETFENKVDSKDEQINTLKDQLQSLTKQNEELVAKNKSIQDELDKKLGILRCLEQQIVNQNKVIDK